MNHYVQFLNEHSNILAAFSWGQYQRHGKGFILVNDAKMRITWRKPHRHTKIYDMVENCDFNECVVIKFSDGIIMRFTPIHLPEISYALVTPQLREFVSSMSPNVQW